MSKTAHATSLVTCRAREFWRDGEHIMHDFRIVALGRGGAQRGVIDSVRGDWRNLL